MFAGDLQSGEYFYTITLHCWYRGSCDKTIVALLLICTRTRYVP